jgi:hypothetical protein
MNKVFTKVAPFGVIVSSIFATLLALPNLCGYLINNLGISAQVAFAITALIVSGGLDAAALVYPIIFPFIGSIQVVIAILGVSFVAGW